MANHPAPTIQSGCGLINQPLNHTATGHTAQLNFCILNNVPSSAQTIINLFQTNFNARMKASFDDEVTIQKPFIRLGDGTNVPGEAFATGASVAGTRAGITATPPQVALLIRKGTAFGGKKNRGRCYFPWVLAIGDVDQAGTISAGVVSAVQAAITTLLNDMNTASLPFSVENRTFAVDGTTGKKYVTEIHANHPLTSMLVETKVATQRRRLIRS